MSKENRIRTTVLLSVSLLLFSNALNAQGIKLKVLEEIYRKYDSISFLTFDVKFIYSSDTLDGDFIYDVESGFYTLAGKYALYSIGGIDFMQNDSFFIAVYNEDRYMIVNHEVVPNIAKEMPGRNYIDSMIMTLGKNYVVSLGLAGTVGRINLKRANASAQFDRFMIEYDLPSQLFQTIQYDFREEEVVEAEDDNINDSIKSRNRKKSFRIEFSNYRLDNFSESVFDINNYVWFDKGECVPVEKYSGFTVYYSGPPTGQKRAP